MDLPSRGMLISGPDGEQTLRLEEVVGGGAFGDVWRAVEVSSTAAYAVKFPRVHAIGTGDELIAFRNEVQAASEIQHPNVVPVLHVEATPDEVPPYLVMEFVEGGTLRERLQQYRVTNELVPLDLIQSWAEGLVNGIAAINEHMLHRDLRPENVLMNGDTPLIADFGLSKVVGAITRSKTFKGAQHMLYMPPEGWKLESNDIQVDMYAMGVVLFEIATLQYPYELPPDVRDIGGLRDMHLFQQPKSVRDLRSDLPVGFSHAVSRLMEKHPEDRFSDWSNARDALVGAWTTDEMSDGGSSGLLAALLEETERLHDLDTQERLEAERQMAKERERRKIDEFQMYSLVDRLRKAVADFNSQSSLGEIEIREDEQNLEYHFRLPMGGRIYLGFGWVEPPLHLKVGEVRFAALVADVDHAGCNYLLCRRGETDLHGQWRVCWVRQRAGLDHRQMPPRVQPFGLGAEQLREIEVADNCNHVYLTEFGDNVEHGFLQAALDAIRRRQGGSP